MSEHHVKYPFFDFRYHCSSDKLQDTVVAAIKNVNGPIVEVGGPTTRGFRLLQDRPMLPSRPIISNVDRHEIVDLRASATAMPFANDTVGMFLASHISRVDYSKFPGSTIEFQTMQSEMATQEYAEVLRDANYVPQHALRIGTLQEMHRTLKPGGLVLFECLADRDVEIAEHLGFAVLHQSGAQGTAGETLDCVLQAQTVAHLSEI